MLPGPLGFIKLLIFVITSNTPKRSIQFQSFTSIKSSNFVQQEWGQFFQIYIYIVDNVNDEWKRLIMLHIVFCEFIIAYSFFFLTNKSINNIYMEDKV